MSNPNPLPVLAFADDALGQDDGVALAARLASGEVSAAELVLASVERARAVDPTLHGVATADYERAIETANRRCTGVFGGIPTIFKDNVDTRGLPTNHGSNEIPTNTSQRTDQIAQLMADLGMVSIGKSAMSEFGFSPSCEPRQQPPTRNPWNPNYSSGASSAGSAALVAAGVVPIAHGNDGGGSIRIPAACCGLVGMKPSRGRLPVNTRASQLPVKIVSEGVLTRTVRDTAMFYAAAEKLHRQSRLPPIGESLHPINQKIRIGLVRDSNNGVVTDHDTRLAVDRMAEHLEGCGHQIEVVPPPADTQFGEDFRTYWTFLAFLVSRFGKRAFGAGFGINQCEGLTRGLSKDFRRRWFRLPGSLRRLKHAEAIVAGNWRRLGVDMILSPVTTHTAPPIGHFDSALEFNQLFQRIGDYAGFTPLANAAGLPSIALPAGRTADNIPIGVQISAPIGADRSLIEISLQLESSGGLRPPAFY